MKLTCPRHIVTEKVVKWEPDEEYAPYNISEFFQPEVLDKWNKLMPRMLFILPIITT